MIRVVDREFFKAANKQGLCRLIPGWECQHKKHNGAAIYRATPEHRANLSAAMKGRVFTEEHRSALSLARRRHELNLRWPKVVLELSPWVSEEGKP